MNNHNTDRTNSTDGTESVERRALHREAGELIILVNHLLERIDRTPGPERFTAWAEDLLRWRSILTITRFDETAHAGLPEQHAVAHLNRLALMEDLPTSHRRMLDRTRTIMAVRELMDFERSMFLIAMRSQVTVYRLGNLDGLVSVRTLISEMASARNEIRSCMPRPRHSQVGRETAVEAVAA